jgi:hypothetical protein
LQTKSYKILRKKPREQLQDIGFGSDFLDMTPKAPAPKLKQKEKDKLDYIKMSNFCTL